MVFSGERDYMATGHETPNKKARHNFTLPNLKWAIQRNLRCMKIDSDGASDAVDQRLRRRSDGATLFRFGYDNRNQRLETGRWRSAEIDGEEGIEEYREKIMSDLRTEKESILREHVLDYEEEEEEKTKEEERRKEELEPRKKEKEKEKEVSPPGVAVQVMPWNLRKRKAACKAPITESENCGEDQYDCKRGLGTIPNPSDFGNKPAKFKSTLSKKDIADDYMAMMGHRPPRRPKKRPKNVQKQIDLLNPASYFTEKITEDMY